jgi:D-erythrulose 4-kinase
VTRIFDDPATFTEDMLAGFVDLHGRYVVRVPGGVVRATQSELKVAVVIGGGSGHYPAFCGVVGPGFADGAVVGNVFTSPSAADAVSVARAADSGAGVLLITGNYAGDVINFTQASQTLTAGGIDTRFLVVTDDVASAPASERAARRGIAGDFTVFKAAAAAADAGYDLDGVARIAELANERTRSLGVAFDGCTLPGADQPLFGVPEGHMALGLGIHGEPGIEAMKMPSASELATTLVQGILDDRPECNDKKVAVILNGLGATKYEELFLLWGHVAALLRDAGFDLVEPEVGELVTSLDMAGCSLTVTWLDAELERFWRAPADSPAYRKGPSFDVGSALRRTAVTSTTAGLTADPGVRTRVTEGPGLACAHLSVRALEAIAAAMEEHAVMLGNLDAVAGDGDHGRGMVKGTKAAVEAAHRARAQDASAGDVLTSAGTAWAAVAGGTSGALWGAMLNSVGAQLSRTTDPMPLRIALAIRSAYDTAASLGGAAPGDKTMLDSLLPFSEELSARISNGESLAASWTAASERADRAASETAALSPKIGRARPLAQRSVGSPDPGATSLALCVCAISLLLPADID